MRLDRFITLNLVQPYHRLRSRFTRSSVLGPRSSAHLPILMYHSISDDPEPGVHPYYRVCTSPARFREQMQWLKTNGYQGVTLKEGLEWLSATQKQKTESRKQKAQIRKSDPASISAFSFQLSAFENTHPVALTFDDGFSDFYAAAWPILKEHGFTATMYLPTAFVSDERRFFAPSTLNPQLSTKRECLTWSEVRELHNAGIEFGSHTVNHPKLVELSWPEIELEIQNSKLKIEEELGAPCPAFAYPYAFPQSNADYVSRLSTILNKAGYENNVTTQIGHVQPEDDLLQLKRLPVNQEDDIPLFSAKLRGAYDWLGRLQSLSKRLRRKGTSPANSLRHESSVLSHSSEVGSL